MDSIGLADELDAVARRLKRMSLSNLDRAYEQIHDRAHDLHRLAGRLRISAKPDPLPPLKAKPGKIAQGTITDRNGNRIEVTHRRRRGTGAVVPKGYR